MSAVSWSRDPGISAYLPGPFESNTYLVSHLFAVPILVLWVELEKSK